MPGFSLREILKYERMCVQELRVMTGLSPLTHTASLQGVAAIGPMTSSLGGTETGKAGASSGDRHRTVHSSVHASREHQRGNIPLSLCARFLPLPQPQHCCTDPKCQTQSLQEKQHSLALPAASGTVKNAQPGTVRAFLPPASEAAGYQDSF